MPKDDAIYYYADGEQSIGPFSLSKLVLMAKSGIISPDVYVTVAESDDWKPLDSICQYSPSTTRHSGTPRASSNHGKSKWRIYLWYAISGALLLVGVGAALNGNVITGFVLLVCSIRGITTLISRYRKRTPGRFIHDLVHDIEREAESTIESEIQSLKSQFCFLKSVRNGMVLAGKITLSLIALIALLSLIGAAIEALSSH